MKLSELKSIPLNTPMKAKCKYFTYTITRQDHTAGFLTLIKCGDNTVVFNELNEIISVGISVGSIFIRTKKLNEVEFSIKDIELIN